MILNTRFPFYWLFIFIIDASSAFGQADGHSLSAGSMERSDRLLKAGQPVAPYHLTAYIHSTVTQLVWTDMQPFDPALKGYHVYRREIVPHEKAKNVYVRISDTLLSAVHNFFTDSSAIEGHYYEYTVQTVDINEESSDSSSTSRVALPIAFPLPPTGLNARRTDNGILIHWNTETQNNLSMYKVYRYEHGGSPTFIGSSQLDKHEFLDTGVRQGISYIYYVTCVNSNNLESEPGREVSISANP